MNPSFNPIESVQGLRAGPLCPYVSTYLARLKAQGFKPDSVAHHLRLVAKLSRWLMRTGRDARDVNERLTDDFLQTLRHARPDTKGEPKALRRFIGVLRSVGVTARTRSARPRKPSERLLEQYRDHLLRERGCSPGTARVHTFYIARFLSRRFGGNRCRVRELKPSDILAFVREYARRVEPVSMNSVVAAVRGFFRFLHYSGRLKHDLSPIVPKLPCWQLVDVPKYLPPESVRKVLASCDQATAVGRRNHAILLLLARLGLRAGEMLKLTLDDVDWENARIILRSTKSGRDARLPLPADVGRALARYLRHDRPRCQSRLLFLRLKAPHAGLSNPAVLSTMVMRTLQRAGVKSVRKGTHLFRHSLATSMLGRGASLQEIGQVLRHRSPSVTAIYAKVALKKLRAIALPWPGGAK